MRTLSLKKIEPVINQSIGFKIVGGHQSAIEQRTVSLFTIQHAILHLGLTVQMQQRKLLLDRNIRFPEQLF